MPMQSIYVLLVSALLVAPLAAAQCDGSGGTLFTTATDFNAALSGCTTWTSSLSLHLSTADAVPLAASLERIDGMLHMQGAGFPAADLGEIFPVLESVGHLDIEDDMPSTGLTLPLLTELGCLNIKATDGSPLAVVDLPSLATVGGELRSASCSSTIQMDIRSDGVALEMINLPRVRFSEGLGSEKAAVYFVSVSGVTAIDIGSQGVGPLVIHSIDIVNAFALSSYSLASEIQTTKFSLSGAALTGLATTLSSDDLTTFTLTLSAAGSTALPNLDDLVISCTKCLTYLTLHNLKNVPNLTPFYGTLSDNPVDVALGEMHAVSDVNMLFETVVTARKLQFNNLQGITTLQFPLLEEVTAADMFTLLCSPSCPLVTTFSAPKLHSAGGVSLRHLPSLTSINVGKSAASLTMAELRLFGDFGLPNALDLNEYLPASVNIAKIDISWVETIDSFSFRTDVPLSVSVVRSDFSSFSVSAPSYTQLNLDTNTELFAASFANADGSLDAASVTSIKAAALCCDDIQSLAALWTPTSATACTETCNACPTGFVGPTCGRCECADSCTDDGTRTGSPTACECVASADNNVVPDCSSSTKVEDDVTLASVAFSGGVQLVTYLDTEDAAFPECTTDGLLAYTRTCHKLHVCMDSTWMELADRPVWAV